MGFWKTASVVVAGAGAAVGAVVLLPVEAAAAAVGLTVLAVAGGMSALADVENDDVVENSALPQAKAADEAKRAREAMDEALKQLRPFKEREGLQLAIFGALMGALRDADALSDGTFAEARSYCFGEFTAGDPAELSQRQDSIRKSPPGLVQAAKQLAGFASVPWTEIGDVMRVLLDAAAVGHKSFAAVLAAWDQASRPYRPNQDVAVARP